METSADTAIAAGVIAVPAAYRGLKHAYVVGQSGRGLERLSINQLYGRYPRAADSGLPVAISREGSNFVFGPVPDSNYTIHLLYWAKPTVMRSAAADAAAHWVIVNAPDLAIYGALCAAEPFIKNDPRFPLWQGLYERALRTYRDQMREEDMSGSPIQEVLA